MDEGTKQPGSAPAGDDAATPENGGDERIVATNEIIEQILHMLGEAWEEASAQRQRADELERQLGQCRDDAANASAGRRVASQPVATAGELQPGVLLVDDSRLMLMRLKSIAESLGFEVLGTADNGLLGAERAVAISPRVIILDHTMPEMDGLATLRAIRSQQLPSRVIVLSGDLTKDMMQAYIEQGADYMLSKPIQMDRLVVALRNCMEE